jgi:hypothetical protein
VASQACLGCRVLLVVELTWVGVLLRGVVGGRRRLGEARVWLLLGELLGLLLLLLLVGVRSRRLSLLGRPVRGSRLLLLLGRRLLVEGWGSA